MSALAGTRSGPGQGGLALSEFKRIAAVLYKDAGIALPEAKLPLAFSRLTKRLRVLRLSNFVDYCALLESEAGGDERKHMLAALTTNVTRFYREPHHFDSLRTEALPPLIEAAKNGRRVRIWSAACSTGEEPYSIGLTALEVCPNIGDYDFKILATDIDPNVLARARAGEYPESAISDVPTALAKKYFEPAQDAGNVKVSPKLRALLTVNELNLIRTWPTKGPFDAIFCRNVVIYFDQETQMSLWKKFASVLGPKGRLYIGHSERLSGAAESLFENVGVTSYQKKS